MPTVPFEQLPNSARLWAFAASRALTDDEAVPLLERVDEFLGGWAAHGVPLTNARDWRYDQFLFVAVDEAAAGVSGCSIDALLHQLKDLETALGVRFTDNTPIMYRASGAVNRVSRQEFRTLAASGAITGESTVFDNTIQTVGALREGRWELPVAHSWHQSLLP